MSQQPLKDVRVKIDSGEEFLLTRLSDRIGDRLGDKLDEEPKEEEPKEDINTRLDKIDKQIACLTDELLDSSFLLINITARLNKIDMRLDNHKEHILVHRHFSKDMSKPYDLMYDTACLIGGHDKRLEKIEGAIHDLNIKNYNLHLHMEEIKKKDYITKQISICKRCKKECVLQGPELCLTCYKNHTFWHNLNKSGGEYDSEGRWVPVPNWRCLDCGFYGTVKEEGKVVPAYQG